jgi:hypothetical protein
MMPETGLWDRTYRAGQDLSSSQYRFVVFSTSVDDQVTLPSAAGASRVAGILQGKPSSGAAASVRYAGLSLIKLASAVTAGDALMVADSTGAAKIHDGIGDIVAIAVQTGVEGELVECVVQLMPFNLGEDVGTFTDGDTTPDVSGYKTYMVSNTSSTTIANFDGGSVGHRILLLFDNGNTTIESNSNIMLQSEENFDPIQYDSLELVRWSATLWVEIGRRTIT